jgi:hypothetical protein
MDEFSILRLKRTTTVIVPGAEKTKITKENTEALEI